MTYIEIVRSCCLGCAVAVILALGASAGSAAAEHAHGAHVHGVSRLNLAIERKRVELELEAPGADVVGFEHAARTAEDKAAVARAAGFLKAGDKLFAFPAGARCRLLAAVVETPPAADEHDHRRDGQSAQAETGHTEFHVRYEFHCDRPGSLTHLEAANFFKRFPAAREIEARAITPGGQHAAELTPAAAKLTF